MNKILLILLIIINPLLLSAQDDIISSVDAHIKKREYNTAFKLLTEKDPNNRNPEMVIKKVDIALNYFIRSIGHQMFAFKDLEANEEIFDLRKATGDFEIYTFPVNEILDSLIIKYPNNFNLNRALGNYYYDVILRYENRWIMNDNEVLELMNRNCEIAANNGAADFLTYYCLGYYNLINQEYEKATTHFLSSIELDPTFASSSYNLAICYLYTNQPKKGATYSINSLKLYEDKIYKADAARVAAVNFMDIDDYKNAKKYFEVSNNLDPNNYYTIHQLLQVELKLGNQKEAKDISLIFFDLDPSNPRICSDLVDIYNQYDKGNDLIELFKLELIKYKGNYEVIGNVYFHLGQYYLGKNETENSNQNFIKAKENFSKVLEKDHYVFDVINEAITK